MSDLSDIDCTAALVTRRARPPDYKAEAEAMRQLALELEKPEGDMLGRLCDVALRICRAGAAGVSILETDGESQQFRWHAIRGTWAAFEGHAIPRHDTPCHVTITRNSTLLLRHPGRVYPVVNQGGGPPVVEVLLAPFRIFGEPLGTVWVVSHRDAEVFDPEDARIVVRLADFASAAFNLQQQLRRARESRDEGYRVNQRLLALIDKLQKPG